jgi:hypothetical protein
MVNQNKIVIHQIVMDTTRNHNFYIFSTVIGESVESTIIWQMTILNSSRTMDMELSIFWHKWTWSYLWCHNVIEYEINIDEMYFFKIKNYQKTPPWSLRHESKHGSKKFYHLFANVWKCIGRKYTKIMKEGFFIFSYTPVMKIKGYLSIIFSRRKQHAKT